MKNPLLLALILGGLLISPLTAKPITWDLWPGKAPGEVKELPPELDRTGPDGNLVAGRRVIRLGNVSVPTITVYKPKAAVDTGAAVIIAPGGGHTILAYDLEGTEVAEWLNSIGVTGIVLKYRVPGVARNPDKKWQASVQDAQRAMSLIRGKAKQLKIDPDRIGIMGFSAGGQTSTLTALIGERLYDPIDEYDKISFRPDFVAPIYSGGDVPPEGNISSSVPPFFMVMAHDDKDRSIAIAELYIALKKAGASGELHIYERGGHGYGLRKTEQPVTSWPQRMEEWMRQLGLLTR